MNYAQFEAVLAELGLSKREFSELVGMNYTSITNWKQGGAVAGWVASWLANYELAQRYKALVRLIETSGLIPQEPLES